MKATHLITALIFSSLALELPARAEETAWPDTIRVVYLPSQGRAGTLARFAPLSEYLEQMLGTKVEPVSFENYTEMIAYLSSRQFELAYLSPATYSQALPWLRLRVLAMELDQDGRRGYHSLILCRSDRPEKCLLDFSGKNFAFTSPESASGFIVPLRHFLRDLHLTPAMFSERITFAGNHRRVIEGVIEGKYDLGAANDMDLELVLEERGGMNPLRTLWKSELIPGAPFCARSDLPESFIAAAQTVITSFGNDRGRAHRLGSGGFIPAAETDYVSVSALESFRP